MNITLFVLFMGFESRTSVVGKYWRYFFFVRENLLQEYVMQTNDCRAAHVLSAPALNVRTA